MLSIEALFIKFSQEFIFCFHVRMNAHDNVLLNSVRMASCLAEGNFRVSKESFLLVQDYFAGHLLSTR